MSITGQPEIYCTGVSFSIHYSWKEYGALISTMILTTDILLLSIVFSKLTFGENKKAEL